MLDALKAIAARRGVSRDEAVRQVLAEHVDAQEACEPEARLTHISTVLRYPQPAPKDERMDRPLRLRLSVGMADRARAVSLMLPGQHRRAHKDYQARALTDAVVTAIAVREPFTDDVLDGLLPLLRHKAALGLWHLVVAATSSGQELALHDAALHIREVPAARRSPEDERRLLVAEALEEDVSWHSRYRFEVAKRIADESLRGEDAVAFEEMLFAQKKTWGDQRYELRISRQAGEWFDGVPNVDVIGRGATAVWRAQRKVELEDFEHWLNNGPDDHHGRRRVLQPPGWSVSVPAGWRGEMLPRGGELPARVAEWVAASTVLVLPLGGRDVVWPLRCGHDSPVEGVEPLVAAARRRKPQERVEFVESMLVEWGTPMSENSSGDDGATEDVDPAAGAGLDALWMSEVRQRWMEFDAAHKAPQLWLPVDKAFKHGLVDARQRRHAEEEARWADRRRSRRPSLDEHSLLAPSATSDPRIFLFAARTGKGRRTRPMLRWHSGSVAQAVTEQVHPELVGCLADAAVWTTGWTLHRVMNQVWHAAFR